MTEKPQGKIITFYSYKGGTGRTMALANVAWVLASNGKRVLAVDWDLEAPGLHRYFYPFLVDKEAAASEGVIDFLVNFENEALSPATKSRGPDWFRPHADLTRYAVTLKAKRLAGWGRLDFVSAGRQDADYTSRVTTFNFANLYGRLGGACFIEAAKERMREEYDYVLIDSRTGVSDSSGVCTVQLPDALVVCFTLNHQSIDGASAVAASVYAQRRKAGRDLRLFPVPTRIDLGEKEKLDRMKEYAKERFGLFPAHIPHEQRDAYWGSIQVLYVPYYAYEEILSPFGDKGEEIGSMLSAVERLTSYLTADESGEPAVSRVVPPPEEERLSALAEFARKPARKAAQPAEAEERLCDAADALLRQLPAGQQESARRALTRLVRLSQSRELGNDTRLKVKLSELSDGTQAVVEQLKDQRLVLVGQDDETKEPTVELSDDALVQRWPRMREWLAHDRDFLYWRQLLQTDIEKWENARRDPDALLHGRTLDAAQDYLAERPGDLNPRERGFIEKSASASRKSRLSKYATRAVLFTAFGLPAVVLLLFLYAVGYQREGLLVRLGYWPQRYTRDWQEEFLLSNTLKGRGWDHPAGWSVERGEGAFPEDGSLLVEGAEMGVLRYFEPEALYDFASVMKIKLGQGTRAAWVLRAQPDKRSGYVFLLKTDGPQGTPVIEGYAYEKGVARALDEGGHSVMMRGCCRPTDAFRIRAEADGYEFRYWVTLDSEVPGDTRTSVGEEVVVLPFRDAKQSFRYGELGLFEPEGGGPFHVEFWRGTGVAQK